jgi:hypothetical protein
MTPKSQIQGFNDDEVPGPAFRLVVLQKCRGYGKLCFYLRTEEEILS